MRRGRGYVAKDPDDARVVPCPCGESRRYFTREDGPTANVHITHIQDSRRHYHRKTAEFYLVIEGEGTLEVGGDEVPLRPGTSIFIEPGTPHRGWGDFRAVIIGVPSLDPEDEYFDA